MSTEQDAFFESLYHDNFNSLKIQAVSKIKNPSMAEELVQETFCVAWQNREKVLHHKNPKAYLRTVLRLKIREYNRTLHRYHKLFLSLDSDSLSAAKAPSNSLPTSTSSILEIIRNTLTKEEWYILESYVFNGVRHLDISKKLGISISASQKRLERVRKKLEDVLPDYRE